MHSPSLHDHLRSITRSLGTPWRMAPPARTGDVASLVGYEGGWIAVTVHTRPSGERLVFQAHLADNLTEHRPHGLVLPRATVARSRPACEAGRDLRRRLDLQVRDAVDAAREHRAAHHRRPDGSDSIVRAVADALGRSPKRGAHSRSVSLGTFNTPLYATAQVVQPLWHPGEHIVRWSIDTSPENALALAEWLRQRASAPALSRPVSAAG
ncbi:hypothetical protein L3Q67_01645 [Saccharothrix sp. AJ9571]|nr:hypothetical protein L3Q67_01645 [Saccharothrix sp. AJ9571]